MNKTKIINILDEKQEKLTNWLLNHDPQKWIFGPPGKWTTGQHVLHLIQSIQPLNKALSLPKVFLKYKFGTSNRATRGYEQVVKRYQERLINAQEVVSPYSQNLKKPTLNEKEKVISALQRTNQTLMKKVGKWTEVNLDKYIVPHPLMGRMPMREIVMWTAYHAEHHHKILMEKY